MSAGVPRTQPWLAIGVASLALHFAWEMLQAPLYEGMLSMPRWTATWHCARASAGDAIIAIVAYGMIALVARTRLWIVHPRTWQIAAYLGVGLAVTVALECLNVYWLGRWSYAPTMPQVLGIGLAPIAQWLVVPPLVLGLVRIHLRRGRSSSLLSQEG